MADYDAEMTADEYAQTYGQAPQYDAVMTQDEYDRIYGGSGSEPDLTSVPLSFGENIAGGLSRLTNTLTLGWGDEIIAGGQSLVDSLMGNDTTYDERLSNVRLLDDAYAAQHPWSKLAIDIPAALSMPVGEGISAAKGVGAKALEYLKLGGELGAIQGAGDAEGGIGTTAKGAALGALLSGALSPVVGLGGEAALKAPGAMLNYLRPSVSAERTFQQEIPKLAEAVGAENILNPMSIDARAQLVQEGMGAAREKVHDEASAIYSALADRDKMVNAQTAADALNSAIGKREGVIPPEVGSIQAYLQNNMPKPTTVEHPATLIMDNAGFPAEKAAWTETIPAATYEMNPEAALALRSRLGKLTTKEGPTSYLANEALGALDTELEKSLKPDALEKFKTANDLWRYMKTTFDQGAGGKIMDEEGTSQVARALLQDAEKTKKVMSATKINPELGSNIKALALQDLFVTPKNISNRLDKKAEAYKAIFGETGYQVLLKTARNENVLGNKLLGGNEWLKAAVYTGLAGGAVWRATGSATLGALTMGGAMGKITLDSMKANKLRALLVDLANNNAGIASKLVEKPTAKSMEFVGKQLVKAATRAGVDLGSMAAQGIQTPDLVSSAQADELPITQEEKVTPEEENKLVNAVIKAESNGKAKAVSPVGAQGLMQLMPKTGAEWAAKLGIAKYDPFDEAQNKQIGTAYLNHLISKFGGDIELGLAAYNSGPGNLLKALAKASAAGKARTFANALAFLPKPQETGPYVRKIMAHYNA